ncbi:MAG: hypothetical protein JSW07_05435, partial [bacterium]
KKSQYGLNVGGELRLLNIMLNSIHHTKFPKELSGTIGFPMHDAPKDSDELGESTDPREIQFKKQLRKIIDAIDNTLNTFPSISDKVSIVESEKQKIQIFIADVADTLQTIKDRLIADLKDSGVLIMKDIEKALISIHLLDDTTFSLSHQQVETGFQCETSQLIWVPKDIDFKKIKDKSYANFLISLENHSRQQKKYEFIRSSRTDLSELVLQKIEQIQREKQTPTAARSILLDTHQKDQRFAFELANHLISNGVDVEFTKESINPTLSLQNFEEYLKYVNCLVIIYGKVAPTWVLGRIKKTAQIITQQFLEQNKANLKCCWIYLLPESKTTKEFAQLPGFFKIDYLDNRHSTKLDPEVVKPLLETDGERGRA